MRIAAVSALLLFTAMVIHAEAKPPRQSIPASQAAIPPAEMAGFFLPPLHHHAVDSPGGFAWDSHPAVDYWIEYWRRPEELALLRDAFYRIGPFRYEVTEAIRQAGLPPEVLWISFVESYWRVDAVSSSGAAGPWQFLVSSARGRGLIIDLWRDERKDPWRSTDAAIRELSFLYRYTGDWLLAMAAYNMGLTRLRGIQEESGLVGFWDLYDGEALPAETRSYVPRILALSTIADRAGREGLPVAWMMPPEWKIIPLERSVPIAAAAEVASMDASMARSAHGELTYPYTPPPTAPYSLKIPAKGFGAVTSWLAVLEDIGAPRRFWRYTVRPGDTLSAIAVKTGVPVAEILRYNDGIDGSALRVGQRLFLPDDGSGIRLPETDGDELPAWTGRYRVEPGDTMWGLAGRFGVSPESLAEANFRSRDGVLRAGSVLTVPKDLEEAE